ncbi:MAG: hypothetical protein J6B48_00445 [Clostridia bacterium]|nr:hypothetical protein [Clostridia bacterium]
MSKKKIFSLILCIVCFATLLVSCAEDDDNQFWLDKYKEMNKGQPEVVETVDIDFYIIKGEGMSEDNRITKAVQDKINQSLNAKYHTNINIKYISESDYAATINGFTEETSGIVLINSEETMDVLSGKLVDLYPYIHGDGYKTEGFGQLNKQISSTLMNAAIVEERGVEKLFCVPNNHVIGSYELIVIDKQLAFEAGYPYSETEFKSLNTWDSTEELRIKAGLIGDEFNNVDYKDYSSASGAVVTRIINAPYNAIAEIENQGYVVNVAKYPEADSAEVYSSAFAVLNAAPKVYAADNTTVEKVVALDTYKLRAMQVIYAINTDSNIRNLMLYGVENINYSIDSITQTVVPNADKPYDMKLEYTGDVFKALYSEKWTKEDYDNGLLQNKDSEK